ncbi:MAG: glycoside hydrolase 100 family protein [Bacteroidota bacterium]
MSEISAQALAMLRSATTPKGILASIKEEANYRRVWSRDSIICGLAGLMAEDHLVIEGLRQSIVSLGNHQGPQGQLPSNVHFDEEGGLAGQSFGGLCGRVDTISWWIIGLCQLSHFTQDAKMAQDWRPQVEKGLALLAAWEFNGKGLVYVPQSGNWADEYILRGYTLFDQLLRMWALRCAARVYGQEVWGEKADHIQQLIKENYWISDDLPKTTRYHQHAFELTLREEGPSDYWSAAFSPGGYIRQFDLLANALALLLGIGSEQQNSSLINYTESLRAERPFGLMPSFWPLIQPGERYWEQLRANYKYHFRNKPFEFQNGGIWPVFNGFWGLALMEAGRVDLAEELLQGLIAASALEDWSFYECIHGQSGAVHGTPYCTWSAAGMLLLMMALKDRHLLF